MTKPWSIRIVALFLSAALAVGCGTTSTTSSTWSDQSASGYWSRAGYVESVQEIVQRINGNPAGGAVAGALIGGLLFGGRGPGALFGAAGGAAVGASASQGSSEHRTYQIIVRFNDGTASTFTYAGFAPFRPGEPVVLTSRGLAHAV